MNPKTDVLLVAVTKVEGKAIISVFQNATGQEPKPIEISKQIYYDLGIVNENRVFLVRSEMGAGGVGASQQTVQKGILALSPTAVIMVGIAFGTNEKKQKIGDVLVSKQLMLYDLQRISTKDGKPQIIPRGDRPSASLRLIKYFRNAELFWDESKFKVNFGLILSGEKLVDNIDFRQQLLDLEPEAIGGEMEGSGLYVACQDPTVDWVLVKSICDWADGDKAQDKEERQQLAAENAARFVLYMLQKLPTLQNMFFNDDFNKEPPENEDVKRPFSRVANQIVTNLNGLSVDVDERNKIIENIVKENEEISSCLKEEDLCRSFAMKMLRNNKYIISSIFTAL